MNTRRRWFLVPVTVVAVTVLGVALIMGRKPLLERFQLDDATRHVLGSWDVIPEGDSPRRVHFSSQLKGLLELQLQATQVTADQSVSLHFRVQGNEIHFHDPTGKYHDGDDGVFRFRLVADRLILEETGGEERLVLRRSPPNVR